MIGIVPEATPPRAAQTISYPAADARTSRTALEKADPHVIVLFGATGDLARRKLLPGLAHLATSELAPAIRVVGTSLEEMTDDEFREFARKACEEFGAHSLTPEQWDRFDDNLVYVSQSAGPEALAAAVKQAEESLGPDTLRLHYLSVPPKAAVAVITDAAGRRPRRPLTRRHGEAVRHRPRQRHRPQRHGPRDLRREPDLPDRPLPRQGGGPEHPRLPVRQRAVRADLEPQLHRPHPDRHPRDARPGRAGQLLRGHRRLQGHGRHAPVPGAGVRRDGAADRARAAGHLGGEEQGLPVAAADRPGGRRARPVRRLHRPATASPHDSDTETFIALKAGIDNWRWAGVPFYLRTGKKMAEGGAHHLDRLQGGAAVDVPGQLGRRLGRPRPPDLRPRRRVQGVAVLLRQAPRPGHAAGEAVDAVLHARDRAGRRRPRGLRAADPRRDARRPHAVHDRRGHRVAVGAVAPAARQPAGGQALPRRHRGARTRSTS